MSSINACTFVYNVWSVFDKGRSDSVLCLKSACYEFCAEQNKLWADCRTGISGQDEASAGMSDLGFVLIVSSL